jgi:hypothetical protein
MGVLPADGQKGFGFGRLKGFDTRAGSVGCIRSSRLECYVDVLESAMGRNA